MHHSEVLIDVLKRHRPDPALGVEVGVQTGNTSVALLSAFPRLRLYMIDPWAVPPEDGSYAMSGDPTVRRPAMEWEASYIKTRERVKFAGERATVWRMTSESAYGGFGDASLDFCFVDGDHSYDGVLGDCRRWWPKLKPSGILFCHDYDSTADWTKGVKPAVVEFAASVNRTVATEERYVAWLVK